MPQMSLRKYTCTFTPSTNGKILTTYNMYDTNLHIVNNPVD